MTADACFLFDYQTADIWKRRIRFILKQRVKGLCFLGCKENQVLL